MAIRDVPNRCPVRYTSHRRDIKEWNTENHIYYYDALCTSNRVTKIYCRAIRKLQAQDAPIITAPSQPHCEISAVTQSS